MQSRFVDDVCNEAIVCFFAGEKLVDAVSFPFLKEKHTQGNQSNDQVHFPVQMVSADQQ